MKTKTDELAHECKRLSESCLYTSTGLFIWLRLLRWVRIAFVVVPLVLGGFAGWRLLTSSDLPAVKLMVAACAFLAGLLPTVYRALKMDVHLERCGRVAAEFKNLQHRFRQAALVGAKKPFADFDAEFQGLMKRLEAANRPSYTAPEFCFQRGRRKIKSGDYTFDIDIEQQDSETPAFNG